MIKKKYSFEDIFLNDSKNVSKINLEKITNNGQIAVIDQSKTYIAGYVEESDYKICKDERIIFGDHTRILKHINVPFITGADGVKVLKLKNEEKCLYKFFYYYLQYLDIPNNGYSRHFKFLKEKEFMIPSIEFQRSVVENIEKIEDLIKYKDEQILEYEKLIRAKFFEMFEQHEYDKKTLNEISLTTGKYGSGASAGNYIDGQPRYVRITDIQEDGRLDSLSMASPKNEKNIDKYILKHGDILFARTGATVGKTYKYSEKDGYCIYAGYCIRFRLNLAVCNPDYIFIYTKTNDYKKWVENKQRIVAQPNINANEYGNELKIPIPPIELQDKFSEFVKKIDKQKEICNKIIDKLNELKKSKMQEYFGGVIYE